MDNLKRPTFEAPHFLVESLDHPKIKAGGSSSSDLLNRYHDTLAQDMGLIVTRTNLLAQRADRVTAIVSSSAAALLSQFQSLSTRVDQASGYTKILCDMHSATYVDTGATDATVDYEFGQATLPVQSTVNLLTQTDVFGQVHVSNEVEVSYAIGSNPNTLDFVPDPEAIYMLREEQAWVLSTATSGSTMWTKIKAPMQYRGLTPNVLELWPVCPFTTDLVEVSYQLAGQSFSSTWTTLNLGYLPLYSVALGRVAPFGPVRIHLPNLPLSQIRIKQLARMDTVWGWESIRLYHREYENQGTLVVKDPYSRTVNTPLLRGSDATALSQLSMTLNGNTCSVQLTTTDAAVTPVITGVILNV